MMKGTKTVCHSSMGTMPKRMGNEMHGSMGKAAAGGGKTRMEGKATTPAVGHQAATIEGGKKGAVKMPKTRSASFGK